MWISRPRLRFMLCVLVGLLCLSLLGLFQAQSEQQAVILLTEEEAARLRLTEEQFEWQVEYERGTLSPGESDPQPGPRIEFQSPIVTDDLVVRATTPLSLSVAFRPNRAPVNERSLRVWARKFGIWQEMTDRVLPYLVPDGDGGWRLRFVIESAVIPRGKFHIEIHIADKNGEWTVQKYFFRITKEI